MAESFTWSTVEPDSWVDLPERISYSWLHDVEACARRSALKNAHFGELKGYPRRVGLAALGGRIVHLALEQIVRSIQDNRCKSRSEAVAALRLLGGIAEVVRRCRLDVTAQLAANPRMAHRLADLGIVLSRQEAELRQIVQRALSTTVSVLPAFGESGVSGRRSPVSERRGRQMGYGFYSEVRLEPPGMGWVGWADVMRLDADVCEILDYKTGEPDAAHLDQLRTYALLWARDTAINPHSRKATRLAVMYGHQTVEEPGPDDRTLVVIEQKLFERVARAATALASHPARAVVSPTNCSFCEVKHLCADYWQPASQAKLAMSREIPGRSIQVVVQARRSSHTWTALVERDPLIAEGTPVMVVVSGKFALEVGQRARLMFVRVQDGDPPDEIVIGVGPSSEIFDVSE
jgi:hypothetical protein